MCTILVNHLEDCPVKVWLGKLTALYMTHWVDWAVKSSTQTNKHLLQWSQIKFIKVALGNKELLKRIKIWVSVLLGLFIRVWYLKPGNIITEKLRIYMPASVAQLDAPSDWRPGGRGFSPHRGRQHSFVEIDREIFSTVILSLPLIQEGQLSISGERMCTILVNRLED